MFKKLDLTGMTPVEMIGATLQHARQQGLNVQRRHWLYKRLRREPDPALKNTCNIFIRQMPAFVVQQIQDGQETLWTRIIDKCFCVKRKI